MRNGECGVRNFRVSVTPRASFPGDSAFRTPHSALGAGRGSEAEPAPGAARDQRRRGVLILHGPIEIIDWYFRFRGKTIHKYCHFFLFESKHGEPVPQAEEGITDCAWQPLALARGTISYDNARDVLERAAEMTQALAQVEEEGKAGRHP